MKAPVIAALSLIFVASACMANNNYADYVRQLSVGTSKHDAELAERVLSDAGTQAFPTLIAHLSDRTPAVPKLYESSPKIIQANDGSLHEAGQTVGDQCFGILQGKIEGN